MKKNLNRIILALLLLVGIVADIYLLLGRVDAEMEDRSVVSAAYYYDIVRLESESGIPEEEWLSTFASAGVKYLIFVHEPRQELLDYIASIGMEPCAVGNLEGDWAFVIPENLQPLRDIGDTPLVVMKNKDRTAAIVPKNFNIETYPGPMIKGVFMYPVYVNRYDDVLRGQEIENVLFRAITDRGARLLLVKPITYKNFGTVLEPAAYAEVLSNLASRIEDRGYTYGESWSTIEAKPLSPLMLWLTGFIPVAMWVFIFTRLGPIRRFGPILSAVGLVGTAAAIYVMPDMAQKLLALACALGFTVGWVYVLYERFLKREERSLKAVPGYLVSIAAVLGWGFLGGLAVASIQTDLRYLMGETIFSGVKLSMALPLIICGIAFAIPILRRIIARDYSRKELISMIPAAVIILAAMAVLVYRSGDTGKDINPLENKLRVFFEYAYYARPRTKEILVAVPFMALLFIPRIRKDSMLHLIGALCCSLECTSLVNTFCHGLAPIHVSLIRGSLAAASGAVLGLLVLGFFTLFQRMKEKALEK